MRPKKFIDPPATADLSMKQLCSEYGKLFFAYRDLFEQFQDLKRDYQRKGSAVIEKRRRLLQEYERRARGGRNRHQEKNYQKEFFIHRFWDLKTRQQQSRVTCDLIRRDLGQWLRNPQPIYGITIPEAQQSEIAVSTARKTFTACKKAWLDCDGDKSIFLNLVRMRRT